MKITVTFESVEELLSTLKLTTDDVVAATIGYERPKDKKAKAAPKAEPVKAEPAPKAEPEQAEDNAPAAKSEPVKVDESYRLELRKVLSDLNKKTGGNEARKLILEFNDTGKLTDVALSDLPALMERAQEALNA